MPNIYFSKKITSPSIFFFFFIIKLLIFYDVTELKLLNKNKLKIPIPSVLLNANNLSYFIAKI